MSSINWPVIVAALQLVGALAWLGVAFQFQRAVQRVVMGIAQPRDAAGSWAFAIAVTQIGFTIRWLMLGAQEDVLSMDTVSLQIWSVLYVANFGCALGLQYTLQDNINNQPAVDHEATNARAKKGLLMWTAVVILSVVLVWKA